MYLSFKNFWRCKKLERSNYLGCSERKHLKKKLLKSSTKIGNECDIGRQYQLVVSMAMTMAMAMVVMTATAMAMMFKTEMRPKASNQNRKRRFGRLRCRGLPGLLGSQLGLLGLLGLYSLLRLLGMLGRRLGLLHQEIKGLSVCASGNSDTGDTGCYVKIY